MNHISTKFRLAAVVALLACGSAASAADFTFNVQVTLKSISPPDAPGVIRCQVYSSVPPPGLGFIPAAANYIGGGSKVFALSKGSYDAPAVAVAVNADAGKNPADARGYVCFLILGGQNCNIAVDAQPCRGAAAAGSSVEVKGEIRPR